MGCATSRSNKNEMNIEFYTQTSPTKRQMWRFGTHSAHRAELWLDYYAEQEKPEGKRVWHGTKSYSRLRYYGSPAKMNVADVPMTDAVMQRAKEEFVKLITVKFETK